MPTKHDRLKRGAYAGDPRVPIDGERVGAALEWRGLSHVVAAREVRGVLAEDGTVTAAAFDKVVQGKTRLMRRSTRDALAKVIGPPVTSAFLGGEEELQMPPLTDTPDVMRGGRRPFGLAGEGLPGWDRRDPVMPPRYDLEALGLERELREVWNRKQEQRGRGENQVNLYRFLLSVSVWREFIFRDQDWGEEKGVDQFRTDAEEFAHHLASALRVLLRPWREGEAELRPYLLRKLTDALSYVERENVQRQMLRQGGIDLLRAGRSTSSPEVELAILDMGAQREPAEFDLVELQDAVPLPYRRLVAELIPPRSIMRHGANEDRRKGRSEAEIARRVYDGMTGEEIEEGLAEHRRKYGSVLDDE